MKRLDREAAHVEDLSFMCSRDMGNRIQNLVQSQEYCRNYREVIVYLLEVMLLVLKQLPNLPLHTTHETCVEILPKANKSQVRAYISLAMNNDLRRSSESYGMTVSELARILVSMALDYIARLTHQGEVVTKEELAHRIVADLSAPHLIVLASD